jgi:hypothetical protein
MPLLRAAEEAPRLVRVTGTVAGMVDEGHSMIVAPTAPGERSFEVGPAFEVRVRAGVAFSLAAHEIDTPPTSTVGPRGFEQVVLGWALAASPAVTGDATVDLDFATGPTADGFSGSFAFPTTSRRDFFDDATPFLRVTTVGSELTAMLGVATRIDLTATEDEFEFEGEAIEWSEGDDLATAFFLSTAEAGSRVVLPGLPPAGPLDLAFPQPVTMTRPIGGASQPISDPIEWNMRGADRDDPALRLQLLLRRAGDGALVHLVLVPPGTFGTAVPALPSTADPDALYGAGPLEATVEHCEPWPSAPGLCGRWSGILPFGLER